MNFTRNVCVDGLSMLFTSDFKLTQTLKLSDRLILEPTSKVTEKKKAKTNRRCPGHYRHHFKVWLDGDFFFAYANTNMVNGYNANYFRIRFENGVFYDRPLFKKLLNELFNTKGITFQSIESLDIALNTNEDLVKKMGGMYSRFCKGELRFVGRKVTVKPHHNPYSDDVYGFRCNSDWTTYNKTEHLLVVDKPYQTEYFISHGLTDNVYRLEFNTSSDKLKAYKNGIAIMPEKLSEADYIHTLFNFLVGKQLMIRSNIKSNSTYEPYKERFIEPLDVMQLYHPTPQYKPAFKKSRYDKFFINQLNELLRKHPNLVGVAEIKQQYLTDKDLLNK